MDNYTLHGAERLAARIRKFWNQQGKLPHVWVEPVVLTGTRKRGDETTPTSQTLYCVKSDMINGLPV